MVRFVGSAGEMDGMTEESPKANQAAADNGGIAVRFQVGRQWRGVTDPERWAEYSQARTMSKCIKNCGCFAPFAGALVPQR